MRYDFRGLVSRFLVPLLVTWTISPGASGASILTSISNITSNVTSQATYTSVIASATSTVLEYLTTSGTSAVPTTVATPSSHPKSSVSPTSVNASVAATQQWTYKNSIFGSTYAPTGAAPSLVNHNDQLIVMYIDRSSSPQLYYAIGDNDAFGDRFIFEPQYLPGQNMATPTGLAIASYSDTLHAVIQDSSNTLFHFTFNDTLNSWNQTDTLSSGYMAPSLIVFNGQLFLAMVATNGNKLMFTTWNSDNGWAAIASANNEATWGVPAMYVQASTLYMLFTADNGGRTVLTIIYGPSTNSWSRLETGGPSESTAYGVAATFSENMAFMVFQENDGSGTIIIDVQDGVWGRMSGSIGQTSSDTPTAAILDGVLNVVWDADNGNKDLLWSQTTLLPYSLAAWMTTLSDSKPISFWSIPGTHDSASVSDFPTVGTQTMSITEQLNAGIRYLDLRCSLIDDVLLMFHGVYPLGTTLSGIISEIQTFLAVRSTETVIVQIKRENADLLSSITFATAVQNLINQNPSIWNTNTNLPTLGAIRGKMQLMRRYTVNATLGEQAIGIDVTSWANNNPQFNITTPAGVSLTVQDQYEFDVDFPVLVQNKSSVVHSLLTVAATANDPSRWYLNFASATHAVDLEYASPEAIALGKEYSGTFVAGVNSYLRNLFFTLPTNTTYGTVLMDFPEGPDGDLIARIVATNFP